MQGLVHWTRCIHATVKKFHLGSKDEESEDKFQLCATRNAGAWPAPFCLTPRDEITACERSPHSDEHRCPVIGENACGNVTMSKPIVHAFFLHQLWQDTLICRLNNPLLKSLHRTWPLPIELRAAFDSELVRKDPDNPQDLFGPSFRPNRPVFKFDVFGPNRNLWPEPKLWSAWAELT